MDCKTGKVILLWSFTIVSGLVLLSHSTSAINVEVGQEAIIICPIATEYPEWTGPPNLATPLTNGSVINEDGFEWSEKQNLNLSNAQTIHTGEYKCSNGITEGLVQLDVFSYKVSVEILNTVKIFSTEGPKLKVTDGEDITVLCQVTGGNPAPTVTFRWRADTAELPDISNLVTNQELMDDKTFTVNASVTFTANQSVDNNLIYCTASFTGDQNDTESSAYIYVLYPPTLLIHGISFFPTLALKKTKLFCDSSAYPGVTYVWMADDQYISDSSFSYQEPLYRCKQNEESLHLTRCESNITINDLKKEDNGAVIKCIYVFEGDNTTVRDVYTIDVPFAATEVSVEGNVSVTIGATGEAEVSVTCASNAGNPTPVPRWYKGNKDGELINTSSFSVDTMEEDYNGKNITQTIDVKVDRTMDGSMITCCLKPLDVCSSVTLDISYPPEILAANVAEYRAYIGDSISIPCIADSKPTAVMAWYKQDADSNYSMISNNTQSDSNMLYLELTDVSQNDSGSYECRAWSESLGVQTAVSTASVVTVLEKPSFPLVMVFFHDGPRVEITTGPEAPAVPRQFFIQYRRPSADWLEIAKPFKDTLPGQTEETYRYDFNLQDLQPDTVYDVRVRSVDLYGLAAMSSAQTFTTDNFGKSMVKDDTVSKTEFRNAILISVFVTAAVFLIIIIIIACAVKNGKCNSSSSKSYVM